ncbi:MAG: PhoX family protein [Gloeocapsa sp. UFS-A4-WI-NPMV-4B04]|jgi:hypothetical protein|nr:PhoX family protein [Gloeocapsa sp. UFS-A4-WI-NPMV-4B04]
MVSRREFVSLVGASAAGAVLVSPLKALYAREAQGQSIRSRGYGALRPDPNGLLDLPRGFQYRAFSRTGDMMSDGSLVPGDHDGMAAFAGPRDTTILIRNHELSPDEVTKPKVKAPVDKQYDTLSRGGTTTLIVGSDRKLIKDYASLAGTYRNCAGGRTPWGSWISCEETTATPATAPGSVLKMHGYNFEVPISAKSPVDAIPLVAMGRFNHEAVAVDPKTGIVYETEDQRDGLFYRFIPNQLGKLSAGGVLEALKIKGRPQAKTFADFPVGKPMQVEWVRIENPNPATDTVREEGFAKGAAQFTRGEGIWYGKGEFYFCCTNGGSVDPTTGSTNGLGQVWRYVPGRTNAGGTIELFVEPNNKSVLDSPDNIVVSPFGDLFICEDGDGEQFVVGVTPQGKLYHFARNAINDREFAGVCFSPGGRTMFVNIQDPGITFAIWGDWRRG